MSRLRVGADGWMMGIRRVSSPNCDARPEGVAVNLIVVHNISLPPGEFGGGHVEQLFTNALDTSDPRFVDLAGLRVSAHLLIERSGSAVQFVSCLDRAWHAGVSDFDGRARCNDFSIGIELEGTDTAAYEDAQYRTLQRLVDALLDVFPVRAVRGHCHIAPSRKTDPGPSFDWPRLRLPSNVSAPDTR